MWRNNLKIALRTFRKDKLYSAISILGLSISIAFCLLMVMYLNNEFSYDEHHERPHNLYRLVFNNYENLGPYSTTPLPIGPALKEDFPEVEAMTRVSQGYKSLVQFNNNKFFETVSFVDTAVADVFKMEFIYGDPTSALSQPNQIILSESASKKYFGDANPIGKTLEIGSSGGLNSRVTGVFKDFPQNTHIQFNLAVPFSTFVKTWGEPELWQQMPTNYTYVRLVEGQQGADFEAKLPAFAERHVGKELDNLDVMYDMAIQPITSIYLNSSLQKKGGESSGKESSLQLLAFIALLVLIIACINYINYTTARFSKRSKEVGVRKIIGANRGLLINQFLVETSFMVLVSGLLAFLIAQLLIPVFNEVAGKSFATTDLSQGLILGSLAALIFLVSLGAGIIPALFLSSFKPIEAIKGKFSNLSLPELSRKYLITTQFTASIVLLISTMVVYYQMDYAHKLFKPTDDEQVALFQINSNLEDKFDVLKEELLKEQGVLHVSAGSNMPTFYGDSWPVRSHLEGDMVQTENYTIENDFLATLGYELLAGRDLDKNRIEDVNSGFILNETALNKLQLGSPDEAIGKTIYWGSDEKKEGRVVGVVKDFHFGSLHENIEPALIQFSPYQWLDNNFMAVRVESEQFAEIQNTIQKMVTEIDPKWVADIKFMDDNFAKLHQQEIQQGRIFGAFAMLAILISCLGLLGLVVFAAERRTKEIGIRKVLGASVSGIVALLSKEFLQLVGISFIIATPIAFYLMSNWLKNFAYHINLQWWMFVVAGVAVLLIAFLTVSLQSIKAALANPVKSLRNE